MCIQFVYINNRPGPDGYKLIVCNNRDERYDKPTTPASFWPSDRSCISGLSNGGTWFGVSKTGKVGALLNVMPSAAEGISGHKPRGTLVVDYLKYPGDAKHFFATFNAKAYMPYNLVLIERNVRGLWECHYQTNSHGFSFNYETVSDGIYSFGNTPKDCPMKKVQEGQHLFSLILDNFATVSKEMDLKENLFKFMENESRYCPDPYLENEYGPLISPHYSSMYIKVPQHNLGTRSTTLFFVTSDDRCVYVEKSHCPKP